MKKLDIGFATQQGAGGKLGGLFGKNWHLMSAEVVHLNTGAEGGGGLGGPRRQRDRKRERGARAVFRCYHFVPPTRPSPPPMYRSSCTARQPHVLPVRRLDHRGEAARAARARESGGEQHLQGECVKGRYLVCVALDRGGGNGTPLCLCNSGVTYCRLLYAPATSAGPAPTPTSRCASSARATGSRWTRARTSWMTPR